MTEITIREATDADADLISVLGTVTFYEAYFEQDDPADLVSYIAKSFAREKILGEIRTRGAAFYIIYADGRAYGYAKLREGFKAECVKDENSIELQRIYLVERAFSKGLGEKLLRHCLDVARRKGFSTLWLGVWEENRRALKFYEKQGFRRAGTLSYPYGDAVGTNLVMEKKLDDPEL